MGTGFEFCSVVSNFYLWWGGGAIVEHKRLGSVYTSVRGNAGFCFFYLYSVAKDAEIPSTTKMLSLATNKWIIIQLLTCILKR